MSADKEIADILARYDENPREATWKVQSSTVIYHKALERIAAKADIYFDKPLILRAERDEAVILVSGTITASASGNATRTEWSIGEAVVNVNYRVSGKQAAYVYAMAEKRAKDRVILKLIGLHGLLYSEEEADDFKQGNQEARPSQKADPRADAKAYMASAKTSLLNTETKEDADQWWLNEAAKREQNGVVQTTKEYTELVDAFRAHKRGLPHRTVMMAG